MRVLDEHGRNTTGVSVDFKIRLFAVHVPQEVDAPLLETLHSGYLAEGPRVKEFEERFGELVQNPWSIALNSGTSALMLALRLAGVQPGDEVLSTPQTCTATNIAALALGARLRWADVDPDSGLLNPECVRRSLRDDALSVKAILCVDWGGAPCDVAALREVGLEFGVKVVQDAAHSLGARIYGQPVGSWADFTCFSTQAIKHITTGDGGVLTCMEWDTYRWGKILRWFGIDRDAPAEDTRIDIDIEEWGWKAHMNDIAATIGIVQLKYLRAIVEQHQRNAAVYDEQLDPYFKRPPRTVGFESAYWLYTLRLPSRDARNRFRQFMLGRGIQVSQVHRRNDEYTVFKPYNRGPLPGVDEFSKGLICIPVHWALTDEERAYIITACNEFARAE